MIKLTDIYNTIKEEMSNDPEWDRIRAMLKKDIDPKSKQPTKPEVRPNIITVKANEEVDETYRQYNEEAVDLDKEIIDNTTRKPIVTYILPKNDDGSYNVIYNDATTGVIYASNDAWDEINNLNQPNMNEEFSRMKKLAGI
jgi:hypothetical protein